ncbi:ABC-type proline/glycine betaine transport system, permease component [Reinekea sp. MED297]|uniref:ABC-type proline/glycine betaine transport system, permease component n=1 Tax=Reinekea blandensis MED297 TaxID=314283 RepID=A4BG36_9GAMM|nr:choline ABC transporter permease subunit [Reinekea blandensis]EAR08831.1 ABC-type proline/glycine betaine transport system, permease component [Reinekea sp. MED297] [Reinekea blandensis MED297]
MSLITDNKLPVGSWAETLIDGLIDVSGGFFDAISGALEVMIESLVDVLTLLPPWLFIGIVAALVFWRQRNKGVTAFFVLSLLLIWNLGYWEETIETFSLIVYATGLCVLLGVPLGIAAAHRPWLFRLLRPILDLMQTIPPFVYLIPALTLFGLGVVPGLVSTIVFAIAAPIRLTYLGISEVPEELLEAGRAFGCTKRSLLLKVEIPAAMSSIRAGITQCIMLSLSMVVIAALVGADGLGKPVVRALNTVDIATGFEAGLAIVLVAIMLDRIFKTK